MYQIECNKGFSLQVEMPLFASRYEKLFSSTGKKVAYFKNEFDNSTFRYRCINFIESLEGNEEYTVTSFLAKEIPEILPVIQQIDLIILQRAIWLPEFDNLIFLARKNDIPVVYDMDDLFFSVSHAMTYINHTGFNYNENYVLAFFGATSAYRAVAEQCDAFIATVPALAREIKKEFDKPCFVVPNFLSYEQIEESEYVVKNREYCDDRFHIGYFSGSESHRIDLRIIENDLISLLEKYDDIDLVIVGLLKLKGKLKEFHEKGRVIFRDFVPYQELQYEIGRVDVNIAPLVNDVFNEAKSELKFFEAGLVKVPSCVSSTEVYRSIVRDGENGFVCKDGEWFGKLEQLYLDRELRTNMAEEAFKTANELYFPQRLTKRICDTYDELLKIK